MNPKSTLRLRSLQPVLLLTVALLSHEARSQSVLAPPPEVQVVPPAMQAQTSEMEVFPPPGRVALDNEPLFRLGPVALRPHVFYRFVHADGLPSGGNDVSSTVQELSPGVLLGLGNHWTLDYTPTWRIYSSDDFRDTLDQYVKLTGGTSYNGWDLSLSQSYSSSSSPTVETGDQTDQETYLTTFRAFSRLNSKLSVDLGLNQDFTYTEKTSKEWSTMDWLNYEFYPRLEAGGGIGFGYVNVSTNSDMTYEQLQGRLKWRATDKISFQVNAGVEFRQFIDSETNQPNLVNPVAGALIQYQPFEFTKLSLGVDRAVSTSILSTNLVTEITGVSIDLNQRLLGKLNLGLGGRYQNATYVDSDKSSADRRDNLYVFNARLGCAILKRGTIAVFYQHSHNSSNRDDFSFTSNQVGFEAGYRF
jgi:hypothetical protein